MTRKPADLEIGVPGESNRGKMEEGGGELGDGIEEEGRALGGAEGGISVGERDRGRRWRRGHLRFGAILEVLRRESPT